jgi:hypothetical protein
LEAIFPQWRWGPAGGDAVDGVALTYFKASRETEEADLYCPGWKSWKTEGKASKIRNFSIFLPGV